MAKYLITWEVDGIGRFAERETRCDVANFLMSLDFNECVCVTVHPPACEKNMTIEDIFAYV